MFTMNLSNPIEPAYTENTATIRFPIGDDELDNLLHALRIQDSLEPNCFVQSCTSNISVLDILKKKTVNADEVNYLAKRLDSFNEYEKSVFQGAIYAVNLSDVKDMINLTFNLHNYTLVQDFKDISAIGLQNYLDKNFCITESEKSEHDFHALGMDLIMTQKGAVTPFGVIYENGMEMEHLYDGTVFPQYDYKADYVISAYLTRKDDISENAKAAWFYFPESDSCLKKALMRLGVNSMDECNLCIEDINKLPPSLHELATKGFDYESLNRLSGLVQGFSDFALAKLCSVADYAHASDSYDLVRLAENLDQFAFAFQARTYEECARYLIADAGVLKPEENAEIDYKQYVENLICSKNGKFVRGGFVCTETNIHEILCPNQEQDTNTGFEMGGFE